MAVKATPRKNFRPVAVYVQPAVYEKFVAAAERGRRPLGTMAARMVEHSLACHIYEGSNVRHFMPRPTRGGVRVPAQKSGRTLRLVTVYLQPPIYKKLAASAEYDRRSVSTTAAFMLEHSLTCPEFKKSNDRPLMPPPTRQ